MNELTVFQNQEFGRLRTAEINDEVWFVGKDVARALGYSNPRDALSRHVDAEDKEVVKHDTPGGKQPITVINESGLYSLVLSSKLPGAKRFKHWVTSEVLPSIRKHGGYGNGVSAEQMVEIAQRMAAAMGAEIVKQLKDVLAPSTPSVQEEVVLMDPAPRRRQRYHSVITMLDPELQREVDEMLESNRYTYVDIVQFLKENGVGISVSSICRYAKRYFYNR